jgi:cell division protein FtsB
MGRYFVFAALVAAIGFTGYEIYGLVQDYRDFSDESAAAESESEALREENEELKGRIEYLAKPENLINEIKSKFNYRLPEERTILVAPEER